MLVLLDTNILLRLAVPVHPMHLVARHAVIKLQANGDRLVLVPQNIYEYWVVATRPIPNNGLGFSSKHTESTVNAFLETFSLLRDERGVFPVWQDLVRSKASPETSSTGRFSGSIRPAHRPLANIHERGRISSASTMPPSLRLTVMDTLAQVAWSGSDVSVYHRFKKPDRSQPSGSPNQ